MVAMVMMIMVMMIVVMMLMVMMIVVMMRMVMLSLLGRNLYDHLLDHSLRDFHRNLLNQIMRYRYDLFSGPDLELRNLLWDFLRLLDWHLLDELHSLHLWHLHEPFLVHDLGTSTIFSRASMRTDGISFSTFCTSTRGTWEMTSTGSTSGTSTGSSTCSNDGTSTTRSLTWSCTFGTCFGTCCTETLGTCVIASTLCTCGTSTGLST